MKWQERKQFLKRLGLPANLLELVESGQLGNVVEAEYKRLDELNHLLDVWEAEHPVMYQHCPWYESREAWKAAGRPKPEWWELLGVALNLKAPIGLEEFENNIYGTKHSEKWRRIKADPKRHAVYLQQKAAHKARQKLKKI